MYVIFNSTVYPSTYHEIPDVVRWGGHTSTRCTGWCSSPTAPPPTTASVGRDAADQEVDLSKLSYAREPASTRSSSPRPRCIEHHPGELPGLRAGRLPGRQHPARLVQVADRARSSARSGTVYGSVGKRTMELAQAGHHLFNGTYLAYLSSRQGRAARSSCLSPWDPARAPGAGAPPGRRACATRAAVRAASTCRASASSRRPTCCPTAAPTCAIAART